MELSDLLAEYKITILDGWIEQVISSYPPETARLYKQNKNEFANPVGQTIVQGLTDLLDELLKEGNQPTDRGRSALESIIKIRAVQDLAPSKAMAFMWDLKKIIRTAVGKKAGEPQYAAAIAELDVRVDTIALSGVDAYVWSRERMYEIKAREAERRVHVLLRRAKLICEDPDGTSDTNEHQDTNTISPH